MLNSCNLSDHKHIYWIQKVKNFRTLPPEREGSICRMKLAYPSKWSADKSLESRLKKFWTVRAISAIKEKISTFSTKLLHVQNWVCLMSALQLKSTWSKKPTQCRHFDGYVVFIRLLKQILQHFQFCTFFQIFAIFTLLDFVLRARKIRDLGAFWGRNECGMGTTCKTMKVYACWEVPKNMKILIL